MPHKSILFWLFVSPLILVANSCDDRTTFVSLPLIFEGQKLVLSSLLSPDSIINIQLTKTYPLNEQDTIVSNYYVTDANVQLFEDSIFIENLVYQNNAIYVSASNKKPQVGHAYYFVVSAPNFDTAYNQPETIPEKVPINNYLFTDSVAVYQASHYNSDAAEFNQSVSRLVFYFQDPPNQANFYSFFSSFYPTTNIDTLAFGGQYDKIAGCSLSGYPNTISDQCFNGLMVAVEQDMFPLYQGYSILNYQGTIITMQSLSPNYYKFIQSREKYASLQDEIFTEPFNVYSNIEGGYGIVAAYNSDVLQVIF